MSQDISCLSVHPQGDQPPIEQDASPAAATLDSWAGPIRVEWDPTAPLTPYGQLPFFFEYLKVANLFDAAVADCPLAYTSPNAPEKRDILGVESGEVELAPCLRPLAQTARAVFPQAAFLFGRFTARKAGLIPGMRWISRTSPKSVTKREVG